MDGEPYTDPNVTLTWLEGLNGISHDLYLGPDETAVAEGTGDTFKGNMFETSYVTGDLDMGTTYYWRVDEIDTAGQKTPGTVWSFTTLPVIPIADPDLIGWWTFDAGIGVRAVDWSGNGRHGALRQGADWLAPGWIGQSGIEMAVDGYVAIEDFNYSDPNSTAVTVCAWIRTSSNAMQAISSFDRSDYWRLEVSGYAPDGLVGWSVATSTGTIDLAGITRVDDGQWHHVAGVFDNGAMRIYVDGRLETWATGGPTFGSANVRYGFIGSQSEATSFDGDRSNAPGLFDGALDDVRIYQTALSDEDILEVMRGDPLLAWDLQPSNGKMLDIRTITSLSWKAGDMAGEHDVYFGTDADAVHSADASDTTGVYRGRQAGTTHVPTEGFAWGQVYYWRIDEVNTDGTIIKGGVRTFTVVDYLIVEDFESYNDDIDGGTAIFQTWIDGWENATGSTVGYLTSPFAERTAVYSGNQSMPLDYNNIVSPFYSEAERTWATPQDWRFNDVNTLVVHFRGNPVDFMQNSVDSFTMGAAGTDIWTVADEFRFAYKRLNGDGTIIARVDSIENTNNWAKAAVMIRESLDPGSRHAMALVSAASGVAFQRRASNSADSVGTTESGIVAPHWVKLTRAGDELTAQHSVDGVTWVDVDDGAGGLSSDTIVMGGTIYIGLALTSHSPGNPTTAEFSNVQLSGGISGQWQVAEIGVDQPGNSPDDLYIALADSGGSVAVLNHPDLDAVLATEWQQWAIDMDTIAGVNLRAVKTMYIGVGNRNTPQPAGNGLMFIDDIRLMQGVPADPNVVE